MIEITDKSRCSGCSACREVCPRGAIVMRPDALGFLYPSVDRELCVDCGLCNEVCPFHAQYDVNHNLDSPDIYAVRHKNLAEVDKSRSGAFFIALSDSVLSRGGAIYGVGYTDHFRVVHKRATTPSERDEFRGSKYVQSDINGALRRVESDLKGGVEVLFSGTPCQTAALRSYLKIKGVDDSKLLICDIVCHGVPSPRVWGDYLAYVERIRRAKALEVNFRDKSKLGWRAHKESFSFADGVVYARTFTHLFYQHIMFRHSCGVCPYTNLRRPSDITLADFWGWERVDPTFNADDRGVSLILVNTPKGREHFKGVERMVDFIATTADRCTQHNLHSPSIISPQRFKFERDYEERSVEYIYKKYGGRDLKNRLLYILVDIVKAAKKRFKI